MRDSSDDSGDALDGRGVRGRVVLAGRRDASDKLGRTLSNDGRVESTGDDGEVKSVDGLDKRGMLEDRLADVRLEKDEPDRESVDKGSEDRGLDGVREVILGDEVSLAEGWAPLDGELPDASDSPNNPSYLLFRADSLASKEVESENDEPSPVPSVF